MLAVAARGVRHHVPGIQGWPPVQPRFGVGRHRQDQRRRSVVVIRHLARAAPAGEGDRGEARTSRRSHPHAHRLRVGPRGVDEDQRDVPRLMPRVSHRRDA